MVDLNRIQKTIDFIEDNLKENIELAYIADNAFISKFHYLRIFHSVVGLTIMEYIRKRRLSEAAKELKETEAKIVDLAYKYEFGSPESFSRAFKKMFKVSPMAYRKVNTEIKLLEKIDVIKKVLPKRSTGRETMRLAA